MEARLKSSDFIFASNYLIAAGKLLKPYYDEQSHILFQLASSLLEQVPNDEKESVEQAIKNIEQERKK